MFLKSKGVKITLYSFLGVFLALFFFFLLTYDFTPERKYTNYKSIEDVRSDFEELMMSSMDKSKTIKVLNVSFNNDFLNNFINALRDEREIDFASNNWFLKGTNFEVKSERFVLTMYANYINKINYKFKIKVFFTFSEDETKYTLSLRRINVGGIILPSIFKRMIVTNKDENSIGELVEKTIGSINFGTFDNETLEYVIQKAEIVESMRSGILGDVIYGSDVLSKDITALYVSSLLNYDLFKLKFKNSINFTVDYSKLLNGKVNYPEEYNDALSISDDFLKAIEDNCILEYLVKGQNIALSDDYLSSLLHMKLSDKYSYQEGGVNIAKLKNSYINYYDEFMSLKLVCAFENQSSVIEIKFKKINNDALTISTITIGYDEGELTGSFIEINKTSDIIIMIDTLDKLGIIVNPLSRILTPKSLITSSRINYLDVSTGTNIYGLTSNNPHSQEISNAVLSYDFINSLPSSYDDLIDNSNLDNLLTSYKALDYDLRIDFLKYLKDYFKETNISVYNYMDEII